MLCWTGGIHPTTASHTWRPRLKAIISNVLSRRLSPLAVVAAGLLVPPLPPAWSSQGASDEPAPVVVAGAVSTTSESPVVAAEVLILRPELAVDAGRTGGIVIGTPVARRPRPYEEEERPQDDTDVFLRSDSDEDGSFRIELPEAPAGSIHLVVLAPAHQTLHEVVSEDDFDKLRLTLEQAAGLAGEVTDPEGPVADAQVSIAPSQGRSVKDHPVRTPGPIARLLYPTVSSSPDGSWTLDGLAPGLYRLTISAPGTFRYEKQDLALVRGETRRLPVELTPASVLEGTVQDPDGAPVAGVKVRLRFNPELSNLSRSVMRSTTKRWWDGETTDEEGFFEIPEVPSQVELKLHMTHPNYAIQTLEVRTAPAGETERLLVQLSRGLVVSGHLSDETGKPVPGAVVALSNRDEFKKLPPAITWDPRQDNRRATADDDGEFQVRGVTPGQHAILVTAFGLERWTKQTLTVTESDIEGVQVTVDLQPILEGRVTDETGSPIAGARVRATGTRPSGVTDMADVTTDGGGRFTFRGFGAKTCSLYVRADGYASLRRTDVATDTRDLRLVLLAPGGISGRVLLAGGEPASAVIISVASDPTASGSSRKRPAREERLPADDGRYVRDGLGAGSYSVTISAPNHLPVTLEGIVVEPGTTTPHVDAQLERGGAVAGVVIDRADRSPVAGAAIQAPPGGVRERYARPGPETSSDAAGRFRLGGLPAGQLTLLVRHPAYPYKVIDELVVPPSGGDLAVEIELGRGGAIAGRVLLGDGIPEPGVIIKLSDSRLTNEDATTDEEGRYRFDNLPAGRYGVMKRSDRWITGWEATRVVMVVEGETTVVDFRRPAARMVGRVLDGERPAREASIHLWRHSKTFSSMKNLMATADSNGRYEIEGSTPGRYEASVSFEAASGEWRRFSAVVQIPDRPVYEHDFVFRLILNGRVVDAETGDPIPGASIRLTLEDDVPPVRRPLPDGAGSTVRRIKSTPDGRFRLELGQPGRFALSAYTDGYAPSRPVGVEVGDESQTVSLRFPDGVVRLPEDDSGEFEAVLALERGERLAGLVVDAGGQPIEKAVVLARATGAALQTRGVTDAEGTFSIAVPSGSESRLSVLPPGHAPVFLSALKPTPEPIPIRATVGGALDVSIRFEPGGLEELEVELQDSSGNDLMPLLRANASRTRHVVLETSANNMSSISFPHLAAGSYTVVVRLGTAMRTRSVTLEDSQATTVEVAF